MEIKGVVISWTFAVVSWSCLQALCCLTRSLSELHSCRDLCPSKQLMIPTFRQQQEQLHCDHGELRKSEIL